jgi:transcription initiation factor IIE alpha subunit
VSVQCSFLSTNPLVQVLLFFLSFILILYRLKDDDLAGRVGLQVKELNKLMATLEKDGLIQA